MQDIEVWARENREALTGAALSAMQSLGQMSRGNATDEEIVEAAITAVVESWVADTALERIEAAKAAIPDADPDVQFEDVTDVVDAFFANEDIVTEGWILIVEPYDRNVRASLDPVHVRVFGNAVSTAHAVGMARMAERRIAATGVEG